MEDHVIVIVMEESKSSEPIKQSDCEKGTGDQIIAMEESKSYDPANSIRYINKDQERFWHVVGLSVAMCLFLIILPAILITSDHAHLLAEHHTLMTVYHFAVAYIVQSQIFGIAAEQGPFKSSIFGVLCTLLISSTISVIEVGIVSQTAAIIILIIWVVIIRKVVKVNWQVINNVDVEALKTIFKFMAIICVISLLFMISCIVHTLRALLYKSA